MRFVARAPGTCGELVQGTWKDINFLVTCPINLYSMASAELLPGTREIKVNGQRDKTVAAVKKLIEFLGCEDTGVSITIESDLPTGKGMASSTADILAACTAVAEALGEKVLPGDLARIALSVEPTDGLMFPGIMVFDHVRGCICRQLSGIPEIDLLVVDTGGIVDTREFNARVNLKFLNRLKEPEVARALRFIEDGLNNGNMVMVGEGATLSAFANQKILEKPLLPELYKICLDYGGIGVNAAHSGTVAGLLFARGSNPDWAAIKARVLKTGAVGIMGPFNIIGGGADILTERKGQQLWQPYYMLTGETSLQQQKSME